MEEAKKLGLARSIGISNFNVSQIERLLANSKFNKDYRVVWPSAWQDHPYYSMERKDVPGADPFGWNRE
ncbi:Aldo-keto reductase [Operophtera brumata]|uniref:Aldo-keto reductase n=1 Tax=Operophtera brumata TaxID=104452 RepID=A0A0L7LRC1_OPEBR|nr:Aldo-keto reductase [Operophtera brumata]